MEQEGQAVKKSKQVILASDVNEGSVTSEHLKVVDAHIDLSPILINADRSVIAVKILWVSVDPYLRLRMKNVEGSFFESFKLNQPIVTRCVSRVIASANPEYKVGDIVAGFSDVSEYALIPATALQKIEATAFVSIEDYLVIRINCMGRANQNCGSKARRAGICFSGGRSSWNYCWAAGENQRLSCSWLHKQ